MTTVFGRQALLPGGWARDVAVTLEGGRVASVETGRPAPGARPVLLPAPANLHSHGFQRAMAGLTERRGPEGAESFWTWRRAMFAFLDRLDPEDVEAITAMAYVEMLESGFASVGEFHYLHHAPGGAPYDDPAEMAARVAAAAETTGIGLTLLPVLYERGGCDGRPLAPGQIRFGSDPDGFARLHEASGRHLAGLPDAALGAAPHSLRAVTPEGLAAAAALGGPIHIHLAEQGAEVEEVRAATGASPVAWLLDHAEVDRRWCLVHCTQATRGEAKAIAATGATVGLCPVTEASLGDGLFEGAAFVAAGGLYGVGTDSNVRVSLPEELRALEYAQRLRARERAVMAAPGASTGRALWDAAAPGAPIERGSGRIEAGAWADLLTLAPPPEAGPVEGDGVLDAWVFTGDAGWVSEVWSAGRPVVSGGRHRARDAVAARYAERLGRLVAAL